MSVDDFKDQIRSLFAPEEPSILDSLRSSSFLRSTPLGKPIDTTPKIVKIIKQLALQALKKIDQFIGLFFKEKPKPTVWQNMNKIIQDHKQILGSVQLVMSSQHAIPFLIILNTAEAIIQAKAKNQSIVADMLSLHSEFQTNPKLKGKIKDIVAKCIFAASKSTANYPRINQLVSAVNRQFLKMIFT